MEETNTEQPEKASPLENDSLALLRKRLRGEETLQCPIGNEFLLKFLRARKFDADAAFKTIQKYFRARRDYPRIFENFSPSGMLYDVICREHKLLAVSSDRDPHGRAVMLVRTGAWNTSICTLDEFTKACFVLVEWLLLDEDVQKRGVVFVIDHKGLSLHHVMQFTPFAIQRLVRLTQDCYPVGVKAVYITSCPAIFHILFSITKTFMRNKLAQRVHVIGSEIEKLRGVVPSDMIPKEAGGTFESYDYDKLKRDLLSRSEYFQEVNHYGYDKANTHL
ncbi:alpha-tocopherol transfer protein-like [Amblyomma americanum]